MSDAPAPLVPDFVDLTDYPDMPLEVRRLRDSSLASDETPETCWSALMLWAAAWHQIPAASVPDSDRWLAQRAGFVSRGVVDPYWQEIRDRVLRGFVKCSDGRLYHRVLAQKALAAWESKARHRHERMSDRIRKANSIREKNGLRPIVAPNIREWLAAGMRDPEPPENSGGGSAEAPGVSGLKGSEGKGSKEGAPPSASLPPRVRASHTRARASADPPAKKASKRCPSDFAIGEPLRLWAHQNAGGLDLELELAAMKDHEFAKPRSDWEATFRNWLRTAMKRGGARASAAAPGRQTSHDRRASTMAGLTAGRRGIEHGDGRPEPPDDEDIVEIDARRVD